MAAWSIMQFSSRFHCEILLACMQCSEGSKTIESFAAMCVVLVVRSGACLQVGEGINHCVPLDGGGGQTRYFLLLKACNRRRVSIAALKLLPPREVTPRGVPRMKSTRENSTRGNSPRENSPRENSPRDKLASRDLASRDLAPRELAPRETRPEINSSRDNSPRENSLRETRPRNSYKKLAPIETRQRETRPRKSNVIFMLRLQLLSNSNGFLSSSGGEP
jgi:hypothetical protein